MQNGKFEALEVLTNAFVTSFQGTCATLFSTSALKRVLLPTFGKPKGAVKKVRQRVTATHPQYPFSGTLKCGSYYGRDA